jgi:hypothetical protein
MPEDNGTSGLLRCTIGGRDVPIERVTYREPNFGQRDPEHREAPFELSADLARVLGILEPLYQDFAADDRVYGIDDEPPIVLKARQLGWPPIKNLLETAPEVFSGLAVRFLGYDVFTRLFGSVENPEFLLNAINEVSTTETQCLFRGRAICLR